MAFDKKKHSWSDHFFTFNSYFFNKQAFEYDSRENFKCISK